MSGIQSELHFEHCQWSKNNETNVSNIPSNWKCEPQYEKELEGVVKWEPVHGTDSTLKYGQEGENDPILEINLSWHYELL